MFALGEVLQPTPAQLVQVRLEGAEKALLFHPVIDYDDYREDGWEKCQYDAERAREAAFEYVSVIDYDDYPDPSPHAGFGGTVVIAAGNGGPYGGPVLPLARHK